MLSVLSAQTESVLPASLELSLDVEISINRAGIEYMAVIVATGTIQASVFAA